jgi:tetratricopeptide (TPR) repeat protein
LLGGAVVGLALGGWFWFKTPAGPAPPDIALAKIDDPAVVEAINAARQEVIRKPRSGAAWGKLGMVLRAHGFTEEALPCFAEAARLDPREPRWPYLHGIILYWTDRKACIPLLERAVELCRDSPLEPRLRLAEVMLEWGRLAEAKKHFRRALEVETDHPRAHLGLGRLAIQRDQLDIAVDHLRRAAASPYARKSARELLAQVYLRRKDRAALKEFGAVAELPNDPRWPDRYVDEVLALEVGLQPRLFQATGLVRHDQVQAGIDQLQDIVADYPNSARAWLVLGKAFMTAKDYPAAEEALDKAAGLSPKSVDAWFQLGGVRFLRGDYRAAADALGKAVRLKPNYALAHYNLGYCRKKLGDRSGAIAAFRAALRYQPDHALARKELDQLLAPGRK